MKGVNKGPGKAATNRAFADSDEDGGNHLALMMMMQATTTTPKLDCDDWLKSIGFLLSITYNRLKKTIDFIQDTD